MFKDKIEYSWDDIYRWWEHLCSYDYGVDFAKILKERFLEYRNHLMDSQVYQKEALRWVHTTFEDGGQLNPFDFDKGPASTVEMLYSAIYDQKVEEDAKQCTAAVLIAACAFSISGGREMIDEEWRGNPCIMTERILHAIRQKFPNIGWHFACTKAFPTPFPHDLYNAKEFGESLHRALEIIYSEVSSVLFMWRPVIIVFKESGENFPYSPRCEIHADG